VFEGYAEAVANAGGIHCFHDDFVGFFHILGSVAEMILAQNQGRGNGKMLKAES
jgi:hypothetical protein